MRPLPLLPRQEVAAMCKKKQTSLKRQLRYFVLGVFAVSCIGISLCIALTAHLKQRNDNMLETIATLSDFYGNVNEMDGYARAFVTDKREQNLQDYRTKQKQAKQNLQDVSAELQTEDAYRISFLSNMLDTYDEQMQAPAQEQGSWYTVYQQLDYTNDLIQNTAPQYHNLLVKTMRQEMRHTQQLWGTQLLLAGALLALLFAVAAFSAHYYSLKISRPISEMAENINLIQKGDYNLNTVNTGPAEMDILTHGFSDMAIAIKNNVELLKYNAELDKQLLEQENENLTMKNLLYQNELKSLQAQINPHFLFNTLNMIAKKAMLSGDNETSQMMENTSALLRYGLDKASKISTLQEELTCIECYFFIQQRRFAGRVSFALYVEPDLPNIPMPAMVLQPLVENSVMHGVRDMTQGAEVVLKAHRFENSLHLHIEDNGRGIASELLEEILSSLRVDSSGEMQTHIGLANVHRRLKMYYGSDMKFSMESEADCGTVITLEIPLEAGEKA